MFTDSIILGLYAMGIGLVWVSSWRLRLLRKEGGESERSCTFIFSEESWERIKHSSEAAQRTPVQELNYALSLLDVCHAHKKQGGKIMLIASDGKSATELTL